MLSYHTIYDTTPNILNKNVSNLILGIHPIRCGIHHTNSSSLNIKWIHWKYCYDVWPEDVGSPRRSRPSCIILSLLLGAWPNCWISIIPSINSTTLIKVYYARIHSMNIINVSFKMFSEIML